MAHSKKECPHCHEDVNAVFQCQKCNMMYCFKCGDYLSIMDHFTPGGVMKNCPQCGGYGDVISVDDDREGSTDEEYTSSSEESGSSDKEETSGESSYSSSDYDYSSSSYSGSSSSQSLGGFFVIVIIVVLAIMFLSGNDNETKKETLIKYYSDMGIPLASQPISEWKQLVLQPGGSSNYIPSIPGAQLSVYGNGYYARMVYRDGHECIFVPGRGDGQCPLRGIVGQYIMNMTQKVNIVSVAVTVNFP